jgi:hypothetical protein
VPQKYHWLAEKSGARNIPSKWYPKNNCLKNFVGYRERSNSAALQSMLNISMPLSAMLSLHV